MRRWLAVMGVGIAAAVALIVLRPEPCPPAAEKLKGVWDADRKFALQKAFAAHREALVAAETALDAFAADWSTAWTQSCAAPAKTRAPIAVCLDARLAELGALAEVLGRPDDAGQATAPLSIERLAALEPCGPSTRSALPNGKVARAELAAAQVKVARSEALRRIGKLVDALEEANGATALAQSSKDLPVLAEALLAKAEVYRVTGKWGQADAALTEAFAAAQKGQDATTAVRVAIARVVLAGSQPGKLGEADAWIAKAGEKTPSPAWQAELDLATAALRLEQHRPAATEAAARAARAHYEQKKQWARRLDATGLLAHALSLQGKHEEAVKRAQEAVEGRVALVGADHPLTLRSRVFLAHARLAAHDDVGTIDALAPITETQLAQMPAASAGAALCARSVARTRLAQAEGKDDAQRCLALIEKAAVGEPLALAHEALAAAWRLQKEDRKALGENEAAVSIFAEVRSPAAGQAIASLAQTQLQLGDPKAARATAFRALKLFDKVPAEHAIDPCPALWVTAEASRRLKAPTAIPEARTALGCLGDHPGRPLEIARAALTLARALGTSPEAILSFQRAAQLPGPQQLEALDALAALRAKDPEAACAAAVEALVRARTEAREKAAKGCKLPRIH